MPRWSASSADSSRLTKRVSFEPNRLMAKVAGLKPEIDGAGRLTKLVFSSAVRRPSPWALMPVRSVPFWEERSPSPRRLPEIVEYAPPARRWPAP